MIQRSAIGIGVAAIIAALCLAAVAADSSRTEKIPAAIDAAQYADFMEREAFDLADLAEGAEIQRRMFNRMTPPGFSWFQPMFPSVVPFNAAGFEESFLADLLGEDRNSVAVYPLSLALDPKTRETLVYNADGKLIATLPADGISRTWSEDADPARVTLQLDLLPSEDVEPYLYVEDRITESIASGVAKAAKTGGVTLKGLGAGEFGFSADWSLTNGTIRLTVTNGADAAEIYSYTVLHTATVVVTTWTNDEDEVITGTNTVWYPVSPSFNGIESGWECQTTNLILTNGIGVWEDANVSSNPCMRFYAAAQRVDTDADGLTDGSEILLHRTDPGMADTDEDGHLDGREIALGTDPRDGNDYFGIVINAALPITNSMANSGEWVELFNVGPAAKSLAGFRLQTALPTGWTDVFTFPSGTSLDSGDFLVVGTNGDFQAALELPDSASNPPAMSGIRLVAPSPSTFVADALLYGFTNEYGISLDGFGEEFPIVSPKVTNVIRRTWIGYDTDHAGDWKNVPSTSWYAHTQGDYLDLDGDGLSNALEIANGLYPKQGGSRIDVPDSDLDGRNDAIERAAGTDARRADTDGDAFPWDPSTLPHGSDAEEDSSGTDPNNADTDGDGIPDGWEIAGGLNPLSADTDSDGILDGLEHSDNDGIPNAEEVANFTNPFDEADSTPRPYLWEGGFPGEEIDEGDIGYDVEKIYRVKVRTNSQPIMVQVQEYGYMAEDFIVECTAPSIYLNPYDFPYRNRLYCLVPSNIVEFTFSVKDGRTAWANESPAERGADILLRHEPASIDLDAGVPESSEESVGFLLGDKSAHSEALRHPLQIVGPSGGWGYASNVQLTYDAEHLRIYDSADGSNAIPDGTQFPVGGGLPVLYAEGIAQSDMREAWVNIKGDIVPVHDRVTATVLKADIGAVGPLADRTLHPDATREPLLLKQTLPAEWNGQMRLALSNALAFEAPTGGDSIDLAQTTFPNAQLPRTVYLAGDGCGLGEASFSVVGLSDCVTNIPLQIFGVNATLDGVAEGDEKTPGGFIADRMAHTNVPRTALTLDAYGPSASAGTLDLTWDSSLVQIYASASGGAALPQYSVPFANFNSTTLYVEGIAPGSNVLTWSYSEQTNCVDDILVTIIKIEVDEVGFTGDHLIKEWPSGTAIDSPDGTSPTWKKTANPDKPVAYTKGSQPTTFTKVSIAPSNLSVILAADFRIKVNGIVVATKNGVLLDGSAVTFENIAFSSSLESTVKKTAPVFEWEMKLDDAETWSSIGSSGPHTFYWTHATPSTSNLFDLALQKACGYIDGNADYAARVNTGINTNLIYRPWQSKPSGYETGNGGVLNAYSDGAAQCDVNAFLLKHLLESVGSSGGEVTYYWGGSNQGEGTYYHGPGWSASAWCSFKCNRPQHDDAEESPRFSFHAMTVLNGTVYDPSYGVTGSPGFPEFAPPDEDNPSLGNFPSAEDVDWDGDEIQDPTGSVRAGSRSDWLNHYAVFYPYWAPAP